MSRIYPTRVRSTKPGSILTFYSMKHAGEEALRHLSDLLEKIMQRHGLKEKKLGIFYRNSKSFLHFHEDPAGLFADISTGDDFDRYP
jgi:hypothetical protein